MRDTANESFSQILQCEFCNYEMGPEHKILYGDSDACKKLLIEGKGVAIDMNPNFIAEELLDGTVPACPSRMASETLASSYMLQKILFKGSDNPRGHGDHSLFSTSSRVERLEILAPKTSSPGANGTST